MTVTTSNPTHPDALRELHASLDRRRRPEDVARLVRETLSGDLTRDELRTLSRASRGALQKFAGWFSSMPEDFARPVGARRVGCAHHCGVATRRFHVQREDVLVDTAHPTPEDSDRF